jgi:hypothetical protein
MMVFDYGLIESLCQCVKGRKGSTLLAKHAGRNAQVEILAIVEQLTRGSLLVHLVPIGGFRL